MHVQSAREKERQKRAVEKYKIGKRVKHWERNKRVAEKETLEVKVRKRPNKKEEEVALFRYKY